jgi:hypothetical protein
MQKSNLSVIFIAAAIITASFCIETSTSGHPVMAFLSSLASVFECSPPLIHLEELVDEILHLVLPNTSDFDHVTMKWLDQTQNLK